MLQGERRSLTDTLQRLSGTAEWGVKAFVGAGDRAPRQPAATGPASGVDYLARRREERDAADAARRAVDATVDLIHRRLREHALDAVLSPAQDARLSGEEREMLLNAAYLVPAARAEEFQSVVAGLTRSHEPDGIVLELTGPWPAYHFSGSAAAA
jgi:acyl transferase domain-containing protein